MADPPATSIKFPPFDPSKAKPLHDPESEWGLSKAAPQETRQMQRAEPLKIDFGAIFQGAEVLDFGEVRRANVEPRGAVLAVQLSGEAGRVELSVGRFRAASWAAEIATVAREVAHSPKRAQLAPDSGAGDPYTPFGLVGLALVMAEETAEGEAPTRVEVFVRDESGSPGVLRFVMDAAQARALAFEVKRRAPEVELGPLVDLSVPGSRMDEAQAQRLPLTPGYAPPGRPLAPPPTAAEGKPPASG